MRSIWMLLLACGCSVVNDPSMHQPEPIAAEDLCDAYADVICEAQANCCPTGGSTLCRGATIAYCDTLLPPFVGDARNGYDPEVAALFINYARALASVCAGDYFYVLGAPDGIFSALRGTLPDGAVCVNEASEPLPFACAGDLQTCLPNDLGGHTCGVRSVAEGPCLDTYTGSCAPGFYCEVRPFLGNRCLASKPPGTTCGANYECSSHACLDGLCLDPTDDAAVRRAYCGGL